MQRLNLVDRLLQAIRQQRGDSLVRAAIDYLYRPA
jgi:hypothetical protein